MTVSYHSWDKEDLRVLSKLESPMRIQEYLDGLEYNSTTETRSPRWIIKKRRAHCMEGALFGAACLERLGFPPLVLDMSAVNDDDHVIAVFRIDGCWGAVAKSNFTTLRYREPVYRSLRELCMSYFDLYFNLLGEKSLRGYSLPQDLRRFDSMNWRTTEADLEDIGYFLDGVRHYSLITETQARKLEPAGTYLVESSMIGSNPAGLFTPGSEKKTGSKTAG